MYAAKDIMLAREMRINYQEELVNKYKMPVLVIRVNYPEIIKENYYSQKISAIMEKTICELFSNSINYKK